MAKIKTKVVSSEIGKFDVDSIAIDIDGEITSICFDKSDNVTKYDGKDIYIINDNGVFSIEPYTEEKQISKK
jgi:hypothetical protein